MSGVFLNPRAGFLFGERERAVDALRRFRDDDYEIRVVSDVAAGLLHHELLVVSVLVGVLHTKATGVNPDATWHRQCLTTDNNVLRQTH